MKDILKRVVYDYRLKNLKGYFEHEFVPDKNPLIISGSPRGGTTWLYEVIEKSTNGFELWEPLHPKIIGNYYPGTNQWFEKYIPANNNIPELENYISDLLRGKYINESMLQKNNKFKTYKKSTFITIKFCRLNGLLPWFINHFPDTRVIQLFRNPLAVISSQIKHGAWTKQNEYKGFNLTGLEYFPDYYKQFEDILIDISSQEEMLAAVWAMNIIPLIKTMPENIHYVKYEDLFLNPKSEFIKMYTYLKENVPDNLDELIVKPSSTTKESSNLLIDRNKQLETWKKNLNDKEKDNILKILEKFGFSQIGDLDYSLQNSKKIDLL